MKTLLLLLSILLIPLTTFSAEHLTASAILPNDKLIWPQPDVVSDVMVQAKFKEIREIMSVTRGETKDIWYYVVYDVVSVEKGQYEPNQISFIVNDWWPTNRYMKMKRLDVPFRERTEFVFYLNKVERTSHVFDDEGVTEVWEIVRWE